VEAAGSLQRLHGDSDGRCSGTLKLAVAEATRDLSVAWDYLHQFDREAVQFMGDGERAALWTCLEAEANEKLSGWRKEAATALIAAHQGIATPPPSVTSALMRRLHDAAQNEFRKIDRQQTMLLRGALSLVLAVAVLVGAGKVLFGEDSAQVAMGSLAGLVGGVFSVVHWAARADRKVKAPEFMASLETLWIRPAVGTMLALPTRAVLRTVGHATPHWGAVFAFCFLAGFSERWFLGLMERLEGGGQ
jgi:hypothetical protein